MTAEDKNAEARRALFEAIAKSKGRDVAGTIANDESAFPFTAAARKKSLLPFGTRMMDDSIYLGQWAPKGLSKKFNVFAAPQDHPVAVTYYGALRIPSSPRRILHVSEKELIEDYLKDDTYVTLGSPWVLPPLEILCGENKDGEYVMPGNLLALHKEFKQAGREKPAGKNYAAHWSCTTEKDGSVHAVDLIGAETFRLLQDNLKLTCRFVRFEEVKPA